MNWNKQKIPFFPPRFEVCLVNHAYDYICECFSSYSSATYTHKETNCVNKTVALNNTKKNFEYVTNQSIKQAPMCISYIPEIQFQFDWGADMRACKRERERKRRTTYLLSTVRQFTTFILRVPKYSFPFFIATHSMNPYFPLQG